MKKIALLGIIVAIILLTSVIFLYNQNQSLKQEITSLNTKIEDLKKTTPEENSENTDLQTYSNKKFNYSINYPKTAKITDISIEQCGNKCVDIKGFYYLTTYRILVYQKPASNILEEYVDNIFKNSGATLNSTKWIDIAGQKGYQVTASVDYSVIYTYLIHGDYLYEINVMDPNEESLTTYDKIIESFKFIQ